MRYLLAVFATAVAVALIGTPSIARAATLAYSFEAPPVNPDGFGPNGGGVTVTQDTIGATQGGNSLKTSVVAGATFVGALTSVVHPSIGDPPGVDYILFDMTIAPGQTFTGGFAVVGVTVFGASQPGPGQAFGMPVQFADFENIGGKAAGTYNDIRIDLTSATHPTTFATGQSFNQIFGVVGSGPDDIIPTGFQLFFNKSADAPLTVYIDNVRTGQVPEPASVLFGGTLLGGLLLGRRRRA
jgi:hypothetical protein